MSSRVLVWDWPTRVFHWALAISFAVAYLTSEGRHAPWIHVLAGYSVGGLLVFRVLWGLVGTRHARFASFVRHPSEALRYLRSLVSGDPEHHTGHNPAGALAVILLLLLGLATVVAGWLTYTDRLDVGELHQLLGNVMLAIVLVHIAAVLLSSRLHNENLVRAMISGHKKGDRGEAITGTHGWIGLLLFLALLGFWTAGFGGVNSYLGKSTSFTGLFRPDEARKAKREHAPQAAAAGDEDKDTD